MLMGMVCSWDVQEQVWCFVCNCERQKESQISEVGSHVPFWKKKKKKEKFHAFQK